MSFPTQDSKPKPTDLPQYRETASLAPSYKTLDPSKQSKQEEHSPEETLTMLEKFRNEREAGIDYPEWHLGASAPGLYKENSPGKVYQNVGHMMRHSEAKGEEKTKPNSERSPDVIEGKSTSSKRS